MNFKSKHILFQFYCFLLIFTSCSENKNHTIQSYETKNELKIDSNQLFTNPRDTIFYDSIHDIIAINSLRTDIYIDLKYATMDNFMKRILYSNIKHLFLEKSVALRLLKCQEYLTSLDSNLHLLVYDGLRPLSVQQMMWDALDSIPVKERVKFVSNPKNGSLHNYGAAVDLTICSNDSVVLDMGAGYDDLNLIAYPKFEQQFLDSGKLTLTQVSNRRLLRKVMRYQGFENISTEWWHFNAFSRAEAKNKLRLIN